MNLLFFLLCDKKNRWTFDDCLWKN